MSRDGEMPPVVRYQLSERHPGGARSMRGEMSPQIDQLIKPTWAEVEEERDRYDQDAKRLRYWRWWFVAMFTFYTTLVGILLLKLLMGQ